MRKITSTKFKTAIAYSRVSTKRQGESGVGLEGQKVAIEEFARRERYEIVDWFQDVASGHGQRNLDKRDGLQKAIEQAKLLHIPILVYDGSRVSRVTKDVLGVASKQQFGIISITEGVLVGPILASSAARSQYERQVISERTSKKLQQLKSEGVQLGNRKNLPEAQQKGADANRKRAKKVAEQIAGVLEDLGDGGELTAGRVVDILNERGIKTGAGNTWTKGAIRRPLSEAREILEQRRKDHYADNPNFGLF